MQGQSQTILEQSKACVLQSALSALMWSCCIHLLFQVPRWRHLRDTSIIEQHKVTAVKSMAEWTPNQGGDSSLFIFKATYLQNWIFFQGLSHSQCNPNNVSSEVYWVQWGLLPEKVLLGLQPKWGMASSLGSRLPNSCPVYCISR